MKLMKLMFLEKTILKMQFSKKNFFLRLKIYFSWSDFQNVLFLGSILKM